MDQVSQGKQRLRNITDLLQERITQYVSRQPIGVDGPKFQEEFSQIKIENDMVNTFFDEINKMSDHFTFNFVETLKADLETILLTLYQSATECATFFTFMLVMLRRLSPIEGSFANTLMLAKSVALRINSDHS